MRAPSGQHGARRDDDAAGEKTPLLATPSPTVPTPLSAVGAALCVVDLFGVFPVLALPRVLLACGWSGVALAIVVVALQAHTARLLGRSWMLAVAARPRWLAKRRRYPYAALAELAFGPCARRAVGVLLNIALFGAYIPDLLFAAENLDVVGLRLWSVGGSSSFCLWLIALSTVLCPLLWLGSPKDMKWVTSVSVAMVVAVAALTWACLIGAPLWPVRPAAAPPPPPPGPFIPAAALPPFTLQAAAIAYGNLVFQFDAHPTLLTVQVDMAEPKRIGHAIAGAYAITAGLSLMTTVLAGALRGPVSAFTDLMQSLPGSPALYAAVLIATLQITLSTLVGGSALFQDIEERFGIPSDFSWQRCLLRGGLLVCAVLLALASPRLPLAMGLLGAAVTGPLSLVLPPLIHARLRARLRPGASFDDDDEDDDAGVTAEYAKLLMQPRRCSVEEEVKAAEEAAAAEAAARRGLVSDAEYRRLGDDTRSPPVASASGRGTAAWRWLWSATDRCLALGERGASGPLPLPQAALSAALVVVGAASSVIALYYSAADALAGGTGRAVSCLGLPF